MQNIRVVLGPTTYGNLFTAASPRQTYSQVLQELQAHHTAGELSDSQFGQWLFIDTLSGGHFPLAPDRFVEGAHFTVNWVTSYRGPPRRGTLTPVTVGWLAIPDKGLVEMLDAEARCT